MLVQNCKFIVATFGTFLLAAPCVSAQPSIKPITNLAGTYERKIAQMPATLAVEKLSGNKIKFKLEAASLLGAKKESAEATGTVAVKNNVAVFEKKAGDAQYSMSMRFTDKAVFVLYDGKGFGPNPAIDPHGVYVRTERCALPSAAASGDRRQPSKSQSSAASPPHR